MREKSMDKELGTLINREITIFLDNKQFAEGVLLDVTQDYLAIDINQKIYYFTFAHIKAFTKKAKEALKKREVPLSSNEFIGILTKLQNEWVTINCFSDQTFCGILSSVLEDYIIVTNNEELHYIATSYIANIHQGVFYDRFKQTKEEDIEISLTPIMTELYCEVNEEKAIEVPVLRLLAVLKKLVEVSKEDVQTYSREKQVNEKNEEPTNDKESPIRINEKRILLTPWSQMNYDQNTIAIPATNRKKRALVIEPPSELNETLKEEKLDLPKTKESPIQAHTERFEEHTAETFINPREKKAMLVKQYYALMRHAGQNSTNLDQNSLSSKTLHSSYMENNLQNEEGTEEYKKLSIYERKKGENDMVEKQFYSLMKHAAKMYRKLRD